MIWAVLDANAIVSANLVEQGISGQILQAARDRRFRLVTSDVIIAEVVRTLGKDRIRRKYGLTAEDVERVRHLLEHEAAKTPITTEIHGVATHWEDDWILATAVSGRAHYLVTGDRQLQALGSYQGVTIVSPRQFAAVLGLPVGR